MEQQVNTQSFPPMAEGDDRLYVQFYMGSIQNEEATAEAGHPVFDAVPFIKILVPGDKNTVIDTRVDPTHKRRFAKLWYQFESNQTQTLSGFPVKDWPAITRAQAEELAYLNIVTVEQLAGCADGVAYRVMNFHELKRKAEAFLVLAKDTAAATKVTEENAALRVELKALQEQMKEMAGNFDAMQRESKHVEQQHSPERHTNRRN